jgi:hypothetical protein
MMQAVPKSNPGDKWKDDKHKAAGSVARPTANVIHGSRRF